MNRKPLKTVILGFYVSNHYFTYLHSLNLWNEFIPDFLSEKMNHEAMLTNILREYLVLYTKKFDYAYFRVTNETDGISLNGNYFYGLYYLLNTSLVDISAVPAIMTERTLDKVDFAYPYKLFSYTFVTAKPVYKTQIFGIFQTLSLTVWITIFSTFIMVMLVSYAIFKKKCTFDRTLFHVLAVLVRQTCLITPVSYAEKILTYSWVIGAMVLCLAYDSVFLSFLAIPPFTKIKHLTDLASAIEKGEYHAMTHYLDNIAERLLNSKERHLQVIGKHILQNNFIYNNNVLEIFMRNSSNHNVAYFIDTEVLDGLGGKYFISEDRFFQGMSGMRVRRGFCCKKLLDTFVHRIMASGIWLKNFNQGNFLKSLKLLLKYPEERIDKRKLTLTDVAPAFIILLSGYFISCLTLIGEMASNRKNRVYRLKRNKRRNIRLPRMRKIK